MDESCIRASVSLFLFFEPGQRYGALGFIWHVLVSEGLMTMMLRIS